MERVPITVEDVGVEASDKEVLATAVDSRGVVREACSAAGLLADRDGETSAATEEIVPEADDHMVPLAEESDAGSLSSEKRKGAGVLRG